MHAISSIHLHRWQNGHDSTRTISMHSHRYTKCKYYANHGCCLPGHFLRISPTLNSTLISITHHQDLTNFFRFIFNISLVMFTHFTVRGASRRMFFFCRAAAMTMWHRREERAGEKHTKMYKFACNINHNEMASMKMGPVRRSAGERGRG